MASRIKKITTKKPTLNRHLASLDIKLKPFHQTFFYKDQETGREFFSIEGSLGWPKGEIPGVGVIVGVEKTDHPKPRFQVLEDVEANDPKELILKCLKLKEKWGYQDECLHIWYGDYMRFHSVSNDFPKFLLTPPCDFDQSNHLEIYLSQLTRSMQKQGGRRRLYLGKSDRIKKYFENFQWPTKKTGEDYPLVVALGGLIHNLLTYKSWEKDYEPEQYLQSPHDYLAREWEEEERAFKQLFGTDLEENFDEYLNNGL